MKAKHKRRDPRAPDSAARAVRGSAPTKTPWFRSSLTLIAGGCAVLAAVWFGARFWRPPDAVNVVNERENGGSSSGAGSPRAQAKVREGNKQAAVVAKVNRANELLAKGQAAEAVEVLTIAMQLDANDEDVRYDLGLAFTRLGRFDEAIQQYGEALRIFPNYVEAHNNLGNVLMRTGKTEEAIAQFEVAVKVMPDYASAHNNLGTALQRAGRTNEALQHFQQAAKLMPEYWEAHFNVATSLLQAGKWDESQGEFETVLRLKPDFEPAKAGLVQVESQRAK